MFLSSRSTVTFMCTFLCYFTLNIKYIYSASFNPGLASVFVYHWQGDPSEITKTYYEELKSSKEQLKGDNEYNQIDDYNSNMTDGKEHNEHQENEHETDQNHDENQYRHDEPTYTDTRIEKEYEESKVKQKVTQSTDHQVITSDDHESRRRESKDNLIQNNTEDVIDPSEKKDEKVHFTQLENMNDNKSEIEYESIEPNIKGKEILVEESKLNSNKLLLNSTMKSKSSKIYSKSHPGKNNFYA